MTTQQLELGYDGGKIQLAPVRRQGRVARAAWWFAQMRRVVEDAVEWQPAPEARPEQGWFSQTHREVKV